MFLKKEMFTYDDQTVELKELSGLQRMDYLEFVSAQTAEFDARDKTQPETAHQTAFLRMGMGINAWLVSRSLWNTDQTQDVEVLYSQVCATWSYDALGLAAERVLALSGMRLVNTSGKQADEAGEQEKPQTPEKS
ncbi:phage minor tail protein G [Salmonella enterica subsp. enterica serovar Irumu]|nr:phage minor tail protein G [Salmonella enterica]ECC3903220.1 phage minor tail protein G [Salmonella enterica subsp. enterica]ECR6166028.1 phage minor tail protein G [Salmonella enterica subsp. enterica serovar Muenchen]EDP9435464.1 phage minor tail protein G [Salmonella enterica subsp. enterica serovar Irumu]EBO9799641.1 phage minor tail protein G [Salmonella enterica]